VARSVLFTVVITVLVVLVYFLGANRGSSGPEARTPAPRVADTAASHGKSSEQLPALLIAPVRQAHRSFENEEAQVLGAEVLSIETDTLPRTREHNEFIAKWRKHYILQNLGFVENESLAAETRISSAASMVRTSIAVMLEQRGRFEDMESGESYTMTPANDPTGQRGFLIAMRMFEFHSSEFRSFDTINTAFDEIRKQGMTYTDQALGKVLQEAVSQAHVALEQLEDVPLIRAGGLRSKED